MSFQPISLSYIIFHIWHEYVIAMYTSMMSMCYAPKAHFVDRTEWKDRSVQKKKRNQVRHSNLDKMIFFQ